MGRQKGSTQDTEGMITRKQLNEYLGPDGTINVSAAARDFGLSHWKMRNRVVGMGFKVAPTGRPPSLVRPSREELLRHVAVDGLNVAAAARDLGTTEHNIRTLAEIYGIEKRAQGWVPGRPKPSRSSMYLPKHILDRHVRPDGTLNVRAATKSLNSAGFPVSHTTVGKHAPKMGFKLLRKPSGRKKARRRK